MVALSLPRLKSPKSILDEPAADGQVGMIAELAATTAGVGSIWCVDDRGIVMIGYASSPAAIARPGEFVLASGVDHHRIITIPGLSGLRRRHSTIPASHKLSPYLGANSCVSMGPEQVEEQFSLGLVSLRFGGAS
jgi:hypothetical protein